MDYRLSVIYEDNHLIAVNKPAGAISQGDKTGDIPIGEQVKQYLKQKYNKPGEVYLGVVHRLDRPVSGVLLFARTSKAAARLSNMAGQREWGKRYIAITEKAPTPSEGLAEHYLRKDQQNNKSFVCQKEHIGAKYARLSYRSIGQTDRYHTVEIELQTGRHHQIRTQLSALGAVIKGDLKYGAKRSNPDGSICLHARELRMVHPVKKEPIRIVAPYPDLPIWQEWAKKDPE